MQNQLLVAVGMSGVGLAQSAYDEALKYSRERVQGGNLICEHKNIKQQLFHMFLRLESSRAFCREVFVYNARMPHNQSHAHALAAKIYGSECAFQVAQSAVSVFGAAGLSREYMVEKLLRDARMCIMSDGDNGLLAIRGASEIQ
jgi:alkylation response protein AidB-like acyl-CoA dehydrogenase